MPSALQAVAAEDRANAGAASIAATASPLALWHLLSLDAPTVAVVWTSFVAHADRVRLPPEVFAAMFVAVWMIYAVDRLLDGYSSNGSYDDRS